MTCLYNWNTDYNFLGEMTCPYKWNSDIVVRFTIKFCDKTKSESFKSLNIRST